MTKKEINYIRKAGKLPLNLDFWSEALIGTMVYGGLIYGVGMTLLNTKNLDNKFALPLLLLVILGFAILYFRVSKLKEVKFCGSKSENIDKVKACLQNLGWKYSTLNGVIYVYSSGLTLPFTNALIIPLEGKILYKFQYDEARGFRPPFLIGIRTYLRNKFEKKTTH